MTAPKPGAKRGARPGNHNALKHGLYAKRFTVDEVHSIERMGKDMDGEMALLRKHINGLARTLGKTEYSEPDLARVSVLGDLIVMLATVMRTQAWMTGRIAPTARDAVSAILTRHDEWEKVTP